VVGILFEIYVITKSEYSVNGERVVKYWNQDFQNSVNGERVVKYWNQDFQNLVISYYYYFLKRLGCENPTYKILVELK
jgi:hypothetical protein